MFQQSRAFPLLAALMLTSQTALAGPVIDRIVKRGSVVLAHESETMPFAYLDAAKRPMGYSIDVCKRLVEAIGKQLKQPALRTEYLPVSSDGRFTTITEGKADIECGSTTNNAERRKRAAFTVPHYVTGARFAVPASSTVEGIDGLQGKRVVSVKGTTPLAALKQANQERLLGLQVLEADSEAKALDMVAAGQADAFAMDDVVLYALIAARKDADRFKVTGKFLSVEALAFMLPTNDAEFKRIVDEEMRRLIYSREIHEIYKKWFEMPIPPSNTVLRLPMNYLLKDFWKYPSDQVPY